MISIAIITKNEEIDIADCIRSCSWSDDIHVLDSFSTDRTVEIARENGAIVAQRVFDNYLGQRNALLSSPFRHEWVMMFDADERCTPELRDAMLEYVKSAPPEVAAVRVSRRDMFMGSWLRYTAVSPFNIRLVRHAKVHYEREVHEQLIIDGETVEIPEHFLHYPFSKGLENWFERHNKYSTMEAREIMRYYDSGDRPSLLKALFAQDKNERRQQQKKVYYKLPMRPWAKFLYMYIARRGFLDGKAGLTYCRMLMLYEKMIVFKCQTKEWQKRSGKTL